MPSRKILLFVFAGVCLFVAGYGARMLTWRYLFSPTPSNQATAARDENSGYDYIVPLLLCNTSDSQPSRVYDPLRLAMAAMIEEEIGAGNVDEASVYFRDLPLGTSTAINVNDDYVPASLMKVPVMITFFKKAEQNPGILTERIFADPAVFAPWDQEIPPATSVESNRSYTIDELITLMIVYSDNRATEMLLSAIDQNVLAETLYDLGVPLPTEAGQYVITPHAYSFFFRVLYNATFLNRSLSERALELLAASTYVDGLRAGVPEDVVIAKKFGEATAATNHTDGIQMHDCGIVYAPSGDYLLCIMTKGDEVTKLSGAIGRLSALVYEKVPELRASW